MKTVSKSKKSQRTSRRAGAMHDAFSWVETVRHTGSLSELFDVVVPVLRTKGVRLSRGSFYRLFKRWQEIRLPGALLPKWKPGTKRVPSSAIAAISAAAIVEGTTIRQAVESLGPLPFTYRTAIRRTAARKQIRELAQLRKRGRKLLKDIAEKGGEA